MLQRIQTVYLMLAGAACVACMCTCIGHFYSADGEGLYDMYNLWLRSAAGQHTFQPWALFALLLVTGTLSLLDICLFKHRALQMRVAVFCIILLVGWYVVYAGFAYIMLDDAVRFRPHWTAALPAAALILHYLAFRGILRDEMLVRSLDRLR